MSCTKTGQNHIINNIQNVWNDRIMECFIKANLFIICCVASGLILIVYLAAFSCEVSWILEAHGELPCSTYILCTQFFVVFVATTILIHGLVTGLPWGLFVWSAVIGLLSIPELIFVMIMTTQHWGLQSMHGLTELISYLIRLVINCFTLICVIPTGLRWRRESQVLSQLQNLATRLQLQTPPPCVPVTTNDSRRSSSRLHDHTIFENAGYQVNETNLTQPSTLHVHNNPDTLCRPGNEFNANIYMPTFVQHFTNENRTQSLMDLRCTLPGMYNPRYVLDTEDKNGKYLNITIDDLKNTINDSNINLTPSLNGSTNEPLYCSIDPKVTSPLQLYPSCDMSKHEQYLALHFKPLSKLTRRCISLENLDGNTRVQKDLFAYDINNYLHQYTWQQQYYLAMIGGYANPSHTNLHHYRQPSLNSFIRTSRPTVDEVNLIQTQQPLNRRNPPHHMQYYGGFDYSNYTNPYITANSKLSLGNESDDYRKYRDVAL